MTRSFRSLAVAVATLALAAAPAVAQPVLFDNGVPDNLQGRTVNGGYAVANDFALGAGADLGAVEWYALQGGTGGPSTLTGGFTWTIFADAAGSIGSQIFTGTVNGATATKTTYGCCSPTSYSYEAYLMTGSLGGVSLGSGTYWISISNAVLGNSATTGAAVFWSTSDRYSGNQQQVQTGGAWYATDSEGAFRLTGVGDVTATPEPASLALLGTGLVGLGAFARRRARRTTTD